MKFLCDQCKAKYQISDDKVAGKTVRMKCRKCGHMIEVRAEVTETSVSRGMPKEPRAEGAASPQPGGVAPAQPRPSSQAGGAPAGRTAAAARAMETPSPLQAPNARGLATSLSAKKPAAPRPLITPPPGPGPGEATIIGPPPSAMPASTAQASGALAGAFQKSIAKDDPALRDITGLKEWYVAINGVPVGPVRVAELRRKASLGAVTEDSLVWQEGMEEWRPVKAYSELLLLVREAAQSGRPPLVDTGNVRQSTPPPPKVGGPYVPRGGTGRAQGDPFRPAPRSNVLPFAPRNAAAEKLEDPEATEVAVSSLSQQTIKTPDPVGALGALDSLPTFSPAAGTPPPVHARPPLSVQISPASGSVVSPFASSGAAGAPAISPHFGGAGDRSSVSLGPPILASEAPPPPKKSLPWIPIALLVMAAAFGITAALVFVPKSAVQPPPPVASVAPPPPTPPPAEPSATPTADIEIPSDPPAAGASGDKSSGSKPTASAPKPTPSASGKSAIDVSELLRGGGSGPNVGSATSSGSSGGGSLTEDQIKSVVSQHQTGVKRSCYERSTSQQSAVNVTVSIVVNGAGQVTSASSSGNEPAVGKCIETSVRGWNFPATGGTTTVNIPFKFVRQ